MTIEDLSDLKRLRALKHSVSASEWERISKRVNPRTLARLRNYDYGLSTEEQFHYAVKILEHASKIVPIPQDRRQGTAIPSDFSIVFQQYPIGASGGNHHSISCLVEVKRAWKLRWKISQRDFDRRMKYAKARGLPLFFAVRFANEVSSYWSMYPADYVLRRKLKLGPGDIMANLFDVITGNFQIHLPACAVDEIYNKDAPGLVQHPQMGALTGLRVRKDGQIIETRDSTNWRLLLFGFSPTTRQEQVEGKRTVVSKTYESQMIPAYHAVDALRCVVHNLDTDTERQAFRVAWLAGKVDSPVTVEHIWAIALDMEHSGVVLPFRTVPDMAQFYPASS